MRLSIVFPIYNEEAVIPILQQKLKNYFQKFQYELEIIFIDDGSTDQSRHLLKDWSGSDSNVHVYSFSQNRGHQEALIEGLRKSTGEWVLTMDADLQDPLEVIEEMIEKTVDGNEIVHTRRISREGENFFRRVSAWSYYRLVKMFFVPEMLLDVGDFRLMSRFSINQYFEKFTDQRMLRACIPQIEVRQCVVPYRRKRRVSGVSKFSFMKLVRLAKSFKKSDKKKCS